MTDPATFARGAALGFEGMDFYVAGRGGALGDVPADVVTAAFWVFAADAIRAAWERSCDGAAATRCGIRMAEVRPPLGGGALRRRTRLRRVRPRCSAGSWTARPSPARRCSPRCARSPNPGLPEALVQHRLNAVRELRGALHGAAVLTVGLRPVEALIVRAPDLAGAFGWTEPFPEPEPLHERWALAEARTDRMLGKHLALLDENERTELVDLLNQIATAVT